MKTAIRKFTVILMIAMLLSTVTAQAAGKTVKTTKVTLDKSGTVTLALGETLALTATVAPENSTQKLSWSTSNKKIATISGGNVTAKAEGTATITAKSGSKKATVKIKVVDPYKPTGVSLDRTGTVTVNLGETLTLTPKLKPDTAQSGFTWTTSNKKIATVSGGTVKAVKEGAATITVKTRNKKTATVKVKVVDPYKPTGVSLDRTGTVTVNLGETLTLTPKLKPDTAQSGFTWTTSNKKIATVSGGTVKAVKEGTATITVKTRNSKTATVKVKIVDPYKATKVVLDRTGTVSLPLNQTLELKATMTPAESTSKLTWSTSSKKIATVSSSGTVKPLKKGTATITVKTSTGKKASVKVKVIDAVKEPVKIIGQWPGNDLDNVVEMGDEFGSAVCLEPYNAKATVTWTSSDPGIARIKSSVVEEGYWYQVQIEPISAGKTTITAATDNGLTASFTLTVVPRILPQSITFSKSGPLSGTIGEKLTVDYAVYPSESIGRIENCATLTSSNPDVATVAGKTDNGMMDCSGDMDFTLTITPKSVGTTTIMVTLRNGVTASIDVIVQATEEEGVLQARITAIEDVTEAEADEYPQEQEQTNGLE